MLGSLILYLKGMRIMMFQLSGFYCSLPQTLNPLSLSLSRPQTLAMKNDNWALGYHTLILFA